MFSLITDYGGGEPGLALFSRDGGKNPEKNHFSYEDSGFALGGTKPDILRALPGMYIPGAMPYQMGPKCFPSTVSPKRMLHPPLTPPARPTVRKTKRMGRLARDKKKAGGGGCAAAAPLLVWMGGAA